MSNYIHSCDKSAKFSNIFYFSVQNSKYATKLCMYIQQLTWTVPRRQLHSFTIVRLTDLEVIAVGGSHKQVRQ